MALFDSHENAMSIHFFKDKKQYDRFQDGKFAITQNPNRDGTTGAVGEKITYVPNTDINRLINVHYIQNVVQFNKAMTKINAMLK